MTSITQNSRRAPWTLWRYMTVELLRLCALTTAIIVTVIAFAATVKFFADGQLSPLETVQFMFLAMVPMVQYALPFSASFAATLVYHRMSADNELNAARAGGVGWVGLLAPALVCGVLISLVLAVMIQITIPRFLLSMERMVTERVGSFIENSIRRGEPVMGGDRMLLADSVVRHTPAAGSEAEAELVLVGVVVCNLDRGDNVEWCAAARVASLAVYAGGDALTGEGALVGARLQDVVVWDRDGAARMDGQTLSFPVTGGFQDDPKFLTLGELRDLRRNPDRMNFIRRYARDLHVNLSERLATAKIDGDLKSSGEALLYAGDSDEVRLTGLGLSWDPAEGDWEVTRTTGERARVDVTGPEGTTTLLADRVSLSTEITPDLQQRRLSMRVSISGSVQSLSADGSSGGTLEARMYSGLSLRGGGHEVDATPPARELVKTVHERLDRFGEDSFLRPPLRDLEYRLDDLDREAVSKMHERAAASVSCIIMLLTGAVTAMRLKDATPLAVYLWSFFPALGVVLTISVGQQMMHSAGALGGLVLWGGVGALGIYTVVAGLYRCAR